MKNKTCLICGKVTQLTIQFHAAAKVLDIYHNMKLKNLIVEEK